MADADSIQPSSSDKPITAAPVISYAAIRPGGTMLVGRYGSAMEAALPAAQLESEGIFCKVLNANVNGLGMPYSGLSDVELHVHDKDAVAAHDILMRPEDDLEPVDDPADAVPVLGDDGVPIHPVAVAAFEKIRDFRDAAAVLASAQLRIYPPAFRSRGSQPAGQGKRFILKVGEPDRERAELLLEQARAEVASDSEPRCPKCNSWRVYPVPRLWKSFKAFWGLGAWPQKQMECLACRHRGSPEDFEPHGADQAQER